MSDQKISIEASVTYEDLPACFDVGDWHADTRTGELRNGGRRERLEPKTMELLRLLAAHPGQVLSREQILAVVWPDVVVADDALARAMFKLRRALGDDPKAARYIETLPKRGYRLIAPVQRDASFAGTGSGISAPMAPDRRRAPRRRAWTAVVVAALILAVLVLVFDTRTKPPPTVLSEGSVMIERADDFYYRYSRADNEAAIELYEAILAREPDRVGALRGLANALTQRMIRWPSTPPGDAGAFTTLSASLADHHLQEPSALRILERAELLARRAIALDPSDSLSHRSLGLALATQSRFSEAILAYRVAITLDADAWGALINLSEALQLTGEASESIAALIAAHEAMTRRYERDKQHILPYYTNLAVLIGDRLVQAGRSIEGETWYRRALAYSPLHPGATLALARELHRSGRRDEARRLCLELNARVGDQPGCASMLGEVATSPGKPERSFED
jgi:transcriptional activator of cad operon